MTTILIAEDNALVGLMMCTDLEAEGYDVLGAFPRAALCLSAAEASSVDLALLDIDLAGGDSGVALAAELAGRRGIACLFVTGQAKDHEVGPPALGVLAKPFQTGDLLDAVADALRVANGQDPAHAESGVTWFAGTP